MPSYYAFINGHKTNVRVSEDGYLLQQAVFGDVVIESPGVNDQQDKQEGSLNPATTTSMVFSNVTTGYAYQIINDGTVNMTYTLSNGGAVTIKANEIHVESEYKFTSLQLVNSSTTTCDYRIKISGV